jgi:hypothetical protein
MIIFPERNDTENQKAETRNNKDSYKKHISNS